MLLLQKYNCQKYRNTKYRNKDIQITDTHNYKLHKYRNTNHRNKDMQIAEVLVMVFATLDSLIFRGGFLLA